MAAYYNEIDQYCAAWLRNLIAANLIAPGDVDTRSIVDVRPDDLKGYDQCHFFAGIGGWSHALRLAGWDDVRPVWTGSCPCQPFSAAGKGKAADDERHLAPAWLSLIAECHPGVVFGEQVEAAIGWGWLDFVFDALEAQGYACGAAVLPTCGVGAPHIRQRVYFVADAQGEYGRLSEQRQRWPHLEFAGCGKTGELADSECGARQQHGPELAGQARDAEGVAQERERLRPESRDGGVAGRMADASEGRRGSRERHLRAPRGESDSGRGSEAFQLGDAIESRLEGHARDGDDRSEPGRLGTDEARSIAASGGAGFWSVVIWLPCRDGKARPTQPGIFPLAHGIPARVGKLRAAGNAISPQVAEVFIRAYDMRLIA